MSAELAILRRSAWTPAVGEPEASPDLPFLPSLFKRRLGQLDRMALLVGHETLGGLRPTRTILATRRGEIGQQYRISSSLAESGEVSPAAFSLSVFNAPISLLSLAELNRGSASAVHAGAHSFAAGLCCCAGLLAVDPEPVLLVAADELLPEAYAVLEGGRGAAFALGLLIVPAASGASSGGERIILNFGDCVAGSGDATEAAVFFRWLETGSGQLCLGGSEWPLSLSRPIARTGAA